MSNNIKHVSNLERSEDIISFDIATEIDGVIDRTTFNAKDESNDYSVLSDEDLVLSRFTPEVTVFLDGNEIGQGNPTLSWSEEYKIKREELGLGIDD